MNKLHHLTITGNLAIDLNRGKDDKTIRALMVEAHNSEGTLHEESILTVTFHDEAGVAERLARGDEITLTGRLTLDTDPHDRLKIYELELSAAPTTATGDSAAT